VGAVVLILAILVTVFTTSEYSPEEMSKFVDEEDQEIDTTSNTTVEKRSFLAAIIEDLKMMPKTMKQLGIVQFCSWFALFGMWVFATPAIAQHIYGLPVSDSSSATYNEAGNWVGILFGIYNGVQAIYAFFLPNICTVIKQSML